MSPWVHLQLSISDCELPVAGHFVLTSFVSARLQLDSRDSRNSKYKAPGTNSLLVSQRHQRIDFCRPPRRNVRSDERDETQQQRYARERQGVSRAHAVKEADYHARRGDC